MPDPHIQGLITLVGLARSRFLYGLDHTPDAKRVERKRKEDEPAS